MEGKLIEIEGKAYDLEDPEQRKAAIKAWLDAKARGNKEEESNAAAGEAAAETAT